LKYEIHFLISRKNIAVQHLNFSHPENTFQKCLCFEKREITKFKLKINSTQSKNAFEKNNI